VVIGPDPFSGAQWARAAAVFDAEIHGDADKRDVQPAKSSRVVASGMAGALSGVGIPAKRHLRLSPSVPLLAQILEGQAA